MKKLLIILLILIAIISILLSAKYKPVLDIIEIKDLEKTSNNVSMTIFTRTSKPVSIYSEYEVKGEELHIKVYGGNYIFNKQNEIKFYLEDDNNEIKKIYIDVGEESKMIWNSDV